MSLTTSEMTPADIAAVTGGNNNGWGGDGFGWIIILFLFAMFGGWGNGFGGNGGGGNGMFPWLMANGQDTSNDVQRGFDQSAVMGALGGIQSSVSNGFANAEVADCNRAMNAQATAYNNQIATMNQNFANQQALDARLSSMEMAQQNCCCENRAGIADLRYTVATEACADRSAISDALKDVIAANTASTQRILDQMSQDKLDAKNEQIQNLQTQLNMANLAASQNAQTGALMADNAAQTQYIVNRIAPYPVPAYQVANPYAGYGCNIGCGCGA